MKPRSPARARSVETPPPAAPAGNGGGAPPDERAAEFRLARSRVTGERGRAEFCLRVQHEVGLALAASTGFEDAVTRVLESLCTSFGWDFGSLWTVDRAAEVLRCVGAWYADADRLDPFAEATRERVFRPGAGLPGGVWVNRAPAWIPDLSRVPDFARAPVAERVGLEAAFAFPIVLGDEVVGVVEFFDREIEEPDPDLLRAFATIGGQIGQHIERQRAQAALALYGQDLADSFENAPIGMHWAAADGTILRANQAELELLGYARDEYVGHHVREFHADPKTAEDLLARLARGETLKDFEARLRAKDGSIKHVRMSSNVLWVDGRFVHTRCFTRDVTQRVLAASALRESEERFRQLVEGVQDYAIHALGPDGKITSWNSGAERLHGFKAEEILGADVSCLYLPTDRASRLPERLLREAAEKGEAHHEGWRLRKDGSRFWADSVITPLRDEQGRLRGFSRLARDITDRMRTEALRRRSVEIEAENGRLVDAWRLQAEFLGAMSRELKTPLGAALAAAERLREETGGPLNDEQRSNLEDIWSGLRHVLRAFDEVFDVVRLESGRIHIRRQRVDLARLAQEARDVLRSHAAEKRVNVEVDFTPAIPEVEADPALLKLVFHNMLWGAIRSAWPDGMVPLYISPEGPDAFRIEIVDDGLDRPVEEANDEAPGAEGRGSTDDEAGLAELRLAVTKRIVEAHGGRVGSRDAPGGGRVHFAVVPRVARPGAESGAAASGTPAVAAPGEWTILVVQDDAASRAWLAWTLSNAGWSVVTATNGEDALALCRDRAFHAIAVDILLHGEFVADVVRGIRAEGLNRSVPLLLATVAGEAEGVAGIRVQDVLSRPVRTDALFSALERAGASRGSSSPVLVLDSDGEARDAVLASLGVLGYGAVGARDAEEALRDAAESLPVAVVLGIDPATGGLEFLRHFRKMPKAASVPVLLCAPASPSQTEVRGLRAAAQADVLTCPGGRARILQEIEGFLELAGAPTDGA